MTLLVRPRVKYRDSNLVIIHLSSGICFLGEFPCVLKTYFNRWNILVLKGRADLIEIALLRRYAQLDCKKNGHFYYPSLARSLSMKRSI